MLFIYTSFIVNNSLRSSRLEVVDEGENKRARGRHARGLSCAHYFHAFVKNFNKAYSVHWKRTDLLTLNHYIRKRFEGPMIS